MCASVPPTPQDKVARKREQRRVIYAAVVALILLLIQADQWGWALENVQTWRELDRDGVLIAAKVGYRAPEGDGYEVWLDYTGPDENRYSYQTTISAADYTAHEVAGRATLPLLIHPDDPGFVRRLTFESDPPLLYRLFRVEGGMPVWYWAGLVGFIVAYNSLVLVLLRVVWRRWRGPRD